MIVTRVGRVNVQVRIQVRDRVQVARVDLPIPIPLVARHGLEPVRRAVATLIAATPSVLDRPLNRVRAIGRRRAATAERQFRDATAAAVAHRYGRGPAGDRRG